MAINKESNGYTFAFAIILVVVVGSSLALLANILKPMQDKNAEIKKQMDILSAMMSLEDAGITRKNAQEEFKNYVDLKEAVVLDYQGNPIDGIFDINGKVVEGTAFDVDIRQEYKDKKRDEKFRNYPLFVAKQDNKKRYIIPIAGKGLWGPIWGNICLDEDMNTIFGASFGHKGETPGLGAEIAQQFFVDRWVGEKLTNEEGEFTKFEIVKDNSGGATEKKVDGITGGTITSKGVEEMANRCLVPYATYFSNLKNATK